MQRGQLAFTTSMMLARIDWLARAKHDLAVAVNQARQSWRIDCRRYIGWSEGITGLCCCARTPAKSAFMATWRVNASRPSLVWLDHTG